MAWKNTGLKGLHNAFAKQPSAVGRMNAPAAMLDTGSMMPKPALAGGASKNIQTPAQHAAVEKAALASAAKRKKGLL